MRKNTKNIKKEEKVTDIVFLLDRSGSMYGSEEDTIGGFNSYIEKMKVHDAKVTTVLFDDRYQVLHDGINIKDIKPLTRNEYFTGGCTALLDAIGKTITRIDNNGCGKVIFIITTDGLENASTEYSKATIKKMIKNHKNYEFIYIGAGIDSFAEGGSIGISKSNIANFSKSSKGIKGAFDSLCYASARIVEEGCIAKDWRTDIENSSK